MQRRDAPQIVVESQGPLILRHKAGVVYIRDMSLTFLDHSYEKFLKKIYNSLSLRPS